MRRVRAIAVLVAVVMVFAFTVGCTGFEAKAYRWFMFMGHTYDAGMKGFADLYKRGLISEAQKAEGMKIADAFYVSYQGGVEALEAYHKVRITADNMGDVVDAKRLAIAALEEAIEFFGDMAELLNPWLKKGGQEPMKLKP